MVSLFGVASSVCCMALTFSTSDTNNSYSSNNIRKMTTSLSAEPNTATTTTGGTSNNKRKPTMRSISSTLSDTSKRTEATTSTEASDVLSDRATVMANRAKALEPLSDNELNDVLFSVQNICPIDNDGETGGSTSVDYDALRALLKDVAHVSHKDWAVTDANSERLRKILFPRGEGFSSDPNVRQMLDRIFTEGNWYGGADHAAAAVQQKQQSASAPFLHPWAVLVTGVNGIRKTTSLYQDWFPQLLKEALVVPTQQDGDGGGDSQAKDVDVASLPTGKNSFFRQLDHMITTLCNEDFALLYSLTSDLLEGNDDDGEIDGGIVKKYTDLKAAIFTRYRTLSELLGALLLREAQSIQSNCLMETSGRDVAMFHYVDHFFPPQTGYNKLALHFQINNLDLAKASVDARMISEIRAGMGAVQAEDVFEIISSNAGGPYGSEVLDGIQEESDRVWKDEILTNKVGKDWYKATIQINAHPDEPWTAQAVRPDGTLGAEYEFAPRQ